MPLEACYFQIFFFATHRKRFRLGFRCKFKRRLDDLEKIRAAIRKFRDERDWMQFHNPKNLACSIAIEAAELLEHFQWKTEKQSTEHAKKYRNELATEIADIAIYLIELADNLGIDRVDAI